MEPRSRPPYSYGGPVPKPAPIKPVKRKVLPAPTTRERRQNPTDLIETPGTKVLRIIAWTVILLIGSALGLAVFVILTVPKISVTKHKLELKQASDLMSGYQGIVTNHDKRRRLAELGDVRGEKFFEAAFKAKLLDDVLLGKLVSKNSTTDSTADRDWVGTAEPMPEHSCSYTAPRADMLMKVMAMQDENRCILFCFNSRNWNNYPDHGVLVFYSDAVRAEYMTFEQARKDWGITEEEWADPAGKLLGKKAPFQHTYD